MTKKLPMTVVDGLDGMGRDPSQSNWILPDPASFLTADTTLTKVFY